MVFSPFCRGLHLADLPSRQFASWFVCPWLIRSHILDDLHRRMMMMMMMKDELTLAWR